MIELALWQHDTRPILFDGKSFQRSFGEDAQASVSLKPERASLTDCSAYRYGKPWVTGARKMAGASSLRTFQSLLTVLFFYVHGWNSVPGQRNTCEVTVCPRFVTVTLLILPSEKHFGSERA
jgi:hypothetical protein